MNNFTISENEFLDPEVQPDGRRKTGPLEVTPEVIQAVVREIPPALKEHRDRLNRESGISDPIIEERGYRKIGPDHLRYLKRLGFSEKNGTGLLIPIRGIDGVIVSAQVRFDNPVNTLDAKSGKRKKLRYLSPPGLDQRVDFPLGLPETGEVWICEGAKKVDALRSRGVAALGLAGVWSWSGKRARKDLESVDWKGRAAVVCFDSDVAEKREVREARGALTDFLKGLGAEVKWVTPPANLDGAKVGIDDYMAGGGRLEDLPRESPDPEWLEMLVRSESGAVRVNSANLTLILQNDERFRKFGTVGYDEFNNTLSIGQEVISDASVTELGAEIELAWQLGAIAPGILRDVLNMIGRRNRFHPVREWLRSLTWDGTPRVDFLFPRYFKSDDNEYSRSVSRCFLIGAVARIERPGSKVDLTPILQGPQGLFKSTGLAALFGPAWTMEPTAELSSKDFLQGLHAGAWLVELAELAGLRRSDIEHVKKILTAQKDKFRVPYGRTPEDFPRQCVFAGTTNAQEFLKDATGNRRFFPVKVGIADIEAIQRDRDQVWAEAFQRFKNGESWHVVPLEVAEYERELVFEVDAWEERITPWLTTLSPQQTTLSEILENCLDIPVERQDRQAQTRVGAILHRLGWRPRRIRLGAGRLRVYEPVQPDEVDPRLAHVGPSEDQSPLVQPSQPNMYQDMHACRDITHTHTCTRIYKVAEKVVPVGPVGPSEDQSHSRPGQPQFGWERLDHPIDIPVEDAEL